ncbi:MAG: hypothetical protein VYD90_10685 [Pseudomonadota bacterium]|nr:hypothetical protein [Pseudomonadota bacterium]
MTVRLNAFSGEIPRLLPRLLPQSAAQVAQDVKLENGAIVPIRRGRYVQRLDRPANTIHQHQGEWLGWPGNVNAVPGPIADDRLYITGDGAPKILADGETFPLAVPRPSFPLSVSLNGTTEPDPDLSQSILYTYTWVTEFDEESEPAPSSNALLWSSGLEVYVGGFTAAPTNRRINRMRIYRSQTSALGEIAFYLIDERPVATSAFVDLPDDSTIQEQLPSLEYNQPPENLTGLISMPNGMMVAFVGKRLYFSEPWRPHAWPEKYILTTDYTIIGLGAIGSSLVIMTAGQPYIAAGTHPESMSMEKLEVNLPCLSMRGIVDLGNAIAYPSPDGLVTVTQAGPSVVTRQLITRDDWQRLNPASFVAGSFAGRYLTAYAYTDAQDVEQRGLLIIDLSGTEPFIVRASDDADAMTLDITTGALYLLRNEVDVYEWDALSSPYAEFQWRSKKMVLPQHANFGAILIEGEDTMTAEQRATAQARAEETRRRNRQLIDTDATGGPVNAMPLGLVTFAGSLLSPVVEDEPSFGATVYADGRPVAQVATLNEPVRLPSGFLALTWEVEVRGNQSITAISLGAAPSELAS